MNTAFKDFIKNNKLPSSKNNGWYVVTPEFAEELLRSSKGNPRGNTIWSRVETYASDMKAGNWTANGEAIVVSKEGYLQEGHHRCHAIIESNTPIISFIIFDAESTKRYNYGKNRNVKNELGVSTLVNQISKTLQRLVECQDSFGVGVSIDFTNKYRDLFEKAEEIIQCGKRGRAVCNKAMCGVVAAAMLKTGVVSEDDMHMFFRVVNSGIADGCPKHAAPALMARYQLEEALGGGRAVQAAHLAITYRALLDFAEDNGKERRRGYSSNPDVAVLFVKEAFDDKTIETKVA